MIVPETGAPKTVLLAARRGPAGGIESSSPRGALPSRV
jgi:hypothetical protein